MLHTVERTCRLLISMTCVVLWAQSHYKTHQATCMLTINVLYIDLLLQLEKGWKGREGDSIVKSTCYSWKGPRFHSQHPHCRKRLPVTPVSEDLTSSHAAHMQQNTKSHKNKHKKGKEPWMHWSRTDRPCTPAFQYLGDQGSEGNGLSSSPACAIQGFPGQTRLTRPCLKERERWVNAIKSHSFNYITPLPWLWRTAAAHVSEVSHQEISLGDSVTSLPFLQTPTPLCGSYV